jgi:hypothetical protein
MNQSCPQTEGETAMMGRFHAYLDKVFQLGKLAARLTEFSPQTADSHNGRRRS